MHLHIFSLSSADLHILTSCLSLSLTHSLLLSHFHTLNLSHIFCFDENHTYTCGYAPVRSRAIRRLVFDPDDDGDLN